MMISKIKIIGISLLLIIAGCNMQMEQKSNTYIYNKLSYLLHNQSYFKLKNYFESNKSKLSETDALYFNAFITKVFSKAEESNMAIEKLLAIKNNSLSDSLLSELYLAKLSNHINLYEYEMAANTSQYIQSNFMEFIDSADMHNIKNELNIWSALKSVPKQEIIKTTDYSIPMMRDKVGLYNIDIAFGDSIKRLIFDTGANFSVIRKSIVSEMGLTLIEAEFYVTAATGMKVNCDLAIADEIEMGGIICKNVVFLVLEDEALDFPQVDYFPNGAIGYPIIEALDEIRINKEDEIFVPKQAVDYNYNNFALDGLMPIIACMYNNDTLRFNFDTGATTTSLYPLFFNEYKEEIMANNEMETFKSGSAGGHLTFNGYNLDELHLKVGNSEAEINDINLHIDDIGGKRSNFHGNFGQDYIKQFDEMILSFKYSSVVFNTYENGNK